MAILQREHWNHEAFRTEHLQRSEGTGKSKIYRSPPANLQKYFDLQEIREASFPVQVEDYRFQTALSRI